MQPGYQPLAKVSTNYIPLVHSLIFFPAAQILTPIPASYHWRVLFYPIKEINNAQLN